MRPGQLSAYAELGVSPLFFTVRTLWVKSTTSPTPWGVRAEFISPMKSTIAKGIRCSSYHFQPIAEVTQ
jgi:hypothetical protein